MIRSQFLFLILSLLPLAGMTQNLFPNPGFELYDQCPNYTSQISRCTDWDSCLGTVDFFHCGFYMVSTLGPYGIPASGDGVIGLAASVAGPWTVPSNRFYGETFRGNLLETLEPGAVYEIKADILHNTVQNPRPGPCLDVGFYFFKSSNPPAYDSAIPWSNPYYAQVGVTADQIPHGSYASFTFSYTPDSCYDAVMIGVFRNDSTSGAACFAAGGTYYFDIDNISLVKLNPAPTRITTAESSADNICKNDCIDFTASSNLNVNSWKWNLPGSDILTSDQQNITSVCYSTEGVFDVQLITTYECDADTVSYSKKIAVSTVPVLNITTDSTQECFGVEITLYAESTAPVYWSTGEVGPQVYVTTAGMYRASSQNECGNATDSVRVDFENCPCEVYLPNAFTPDNNGNNDHFRAKADCVFQEFSLQIFDRWGRVVFSTTDISAGWDGRYNGQVCPQGIYAVSMAWSGYRDMRLKKSRFGGTVALIR